MKNNKLFFEIVVFYCCICVFIAPSCYASCHNIQDIDDINQWSGTGFALRNGYVVTSNHVVDGATSIMIRGIKGDFYTSYSAIVVASDQNNDLALLKIKDGQFNGFGTVPYSVKMSGIEVGENVFTLGYPLTTTMGDEIKYTTGVISSKTGFQGDASLYQISAPVQPGNSGGPLFDNEGNVIGIINAKHLGAENVGYAVKTFFLQNVIESFASTARLPTTNTVSKLSRTEKIKVLKQYVYQIECSNGSAATSTPVYSNTNTTTTPTQSTPSYSSYEYKEETYNDRLMDEKFAFDASQLPRCDYFSPNKIIHNPKAYGSENVYSKNVVINNVVITEKYTILEMTCTGTWDHPEGIDRNARLIAEGHLYHLIKAENIPYSPAKLQIPTGSRKTCFRLYFPKIKENAKWFDFVENNNSTWRFYNIRLD